MGERRRPSRLDWPSPGGRGSLSWDTRPRLPTGPRLGVRPALHSPGSERSASSDPEQALEPAAVEAHDDLVVHRDHRHRHPAGPRDELLARRRILGDVPRRERDPPGRRKLFRRVAGLSGGGPRTRPTSWPRARPSPTSRPNSAMRGPPRRSRTARTGSRRTTGAGSSVSPHVARRNRKSLARNRVSPRRVFRKFLNLLEPGAGVEPATY